VANLTVMQLRPDLTEAEQQMLPQLEQSARAEVKLRQKAMQFGAGTLGSAPSAPAARSPGGNTQSPAPKST
jgi:hypothetical protein